MIPLFFPSGVVNGWWSSSRYCTSLFIPPLPPLFSVCVWCDVKRKGRKGNRRGPTHSFFYWFVVWRWGGEEMLKWSGIIRPEVFKTGFFLLLLFLLLLLHHYSFQQHPFKGIFYIFLFFIEGLWAKRGLIDLLECVATSIKRERQRKRESEHDPLPPRPFFLNRLENTFMRVFYKPGFVSAGMYVRIPLVVSNRGCHPALQTKNLRAGRRKWHSRRVSPCAGRSLLLPLGRSTSLRGHEYPSKISLDVCIDESRPPQMYRRGVPKERQNLLMCKHC